MNQDTVYLLQNVDSGCKTAVNSILQVKDYVKHKGFCDLLEDYYHRHSQIGDRCRQLLTDSGFDDRDPKPAGKLFMELSTSLKLSTGCDAAKCADIMAEGCAMGIRSVSRYRNRYPSAEPAAADLANQLIGTEQSFFNDLLPYL